MLQCCSPVRTAPVKARYHEFNHGHINECSSTLSRRRVQSKPEKLSTDRHPGLLLQSSRATDAIATRGKLLLFHVQYPVKRKIWDHSRLKVRIKEIDTSSGVHVLTGARSCHCLNHRSPALKMWAVNCVREASMIHGTLREKSWSPRGTQYIKVVK